MQQLTKLAGLLPVVALPPEAGNHYGSIRAALESKAKRPAIATFGLPAHAKAAGLILVTNNAQEFRRVRALSLAKNG